MKYIKKEYYPLIADCPNIHTSGSIRGMKKLGWWNKHDIIVRCGNYYYNLSALSVIDRQILAVE